MTTTLLTIFAVILSAGRYDDHYTTIVRCFTKREDADLFVARKNNDVAECRGMARASNALLEEWEKSHPAPKDYNDSSYGAWSETKYAESERLDTLIGVSVAFDRIKIDPYHGEDAGYYVKETKLDGSPYSDE